MVKVVPIPTISNRVDKNFPKVRRLKVRKTMIQSESQAEEKQQQHWIVRCFKEFAANTALHGYIHTVRPGASKWERIIWLFIVVAATIAAILLLFISMKWHLSKPTITVIESTHYPIYNVHFPAITLCNLNKISAKRAREVASSMKLPNNITVDKLSNMFKLMLHFHGVGVASEAEYQTLHRILQTNNKTINGLMDYFAPRCEEMLQTCQWKGVISRCNALFQTIKTIEGSCCSFNYYGLSRNNFPPKVAQLRPKKPRRTSATGLQTGLVVVLTPTSEDYHSSFFSSYGIQALIHDPYDFADDNAESEIISTKMVAFVSIYPEAIYSTDDVRGLKPDIRACYFPDEYKLNCMQRYSYLNCLAECRTEIIYRFCGCVPYNLVNNGSYRICEMNEILCVKKHWSAINGALPGIEKTTMFAHEPKIQDTPCNCRSVCDIQQYPSVITSAVLNRTVSHSRFGLYNGINVTDHITLTFYFGDLVSTHYRKDIHHNWLSLLASFGGILGLLLGFSFVAGFEFVYFFTIRVFFDRLTAKKQKSQLRGRN